MKKVKKMEDSVKYSGKQLRKKVFELITEHWPIHPSAVCRKLKIADSVSNISKIKYHFDKLRAENKILTKKIDRALIAWPNNIEQSRELNTAAVQAEENKEYKEGELKSDALPDSFAEKEILEN